MKNGYFPKNPHFIAIGSYSVKTVADTVGTNMLLIVTGTSDELLSGANTDDIE